jgi:hypothetical protein
VLIISRNVLLDPQLWTPHKAQRLQELRFGLRVAHVLCLLCLGTSVNGLERVEPD